MARRGVPEQFLRGFSIGQSSPVAHPLSGHQQNEEYWELVKEGPIGLPETSANTSKTHGTKGGRLRQRWMTLARLKCNCGCLSGNTAPGRGQTVLLRTSKLAGNGRRKAQDYDLSCYRMITSAFSSSVGTLGPKAGGGNYHFTIHAVADYTFAAADESCMLSWVAALKEVLSQPATATTHPVPQQAAKIFAVEYSCSSSPTSSVHPPHISTQTTGLLKLDERSMVLKHPLTEETATTVEVASITDIEVHTVRHCLEMKICGRCSKTTTTLYRINTQSSVRRLAEAILLRRNLHAPGPPGQREWSCSLLHSCDGELSTAGTSRTTHSTVFSPPSSATSTGSNQLQTAHGANHALAAAATAAASIPRKVTVRRRSLGILSLEKQTMTALREGEVVNIRRSLPPDASATSSSPVAAQRRLPIDVGTTSRPVASARPADGHALMLSGRSRSDSTGSSAACPSPAPRKHARLARARDSSSRTATRQRQRHSWHSDAERTESSQSSCSCVGHTEHNSTAHAGFMPADNRCPLHVSASNTSPISNSAIDVENSDDEGYISMAQHGRRSTPAHAHSSDASPTAPSKGSFPMAASRSNSAQAEERPQPPPKPTSLRMLSSSSLGTDYDQSPLCTPGIYPAGEGFLDYEDVETEDDDDGDSDGVEEGSEAQLPIIIGQTYGRYSDYEEYEGQQQFPGVCEYQSWEDGDEECHYIVPEALPSSHFVKRPSMETMPRRVARSKSESTPAADDSSGAASGNASAAAHGDYIEFLSEGDGGQLRETQSDAVAATADFGTGREEPEAWGRHQIELQRSIRLRIARRNCFQRLNTNQPIREDFIVDSLDDCRLDDQNSRTPSAYTPRPKPRRIVRNSALTATF
ncbi:uncharacterized protein LOC135806240 [Sycon ciliatum]|uniref:uncharacterized protein LOC135806240 n=1 Tax=Sycon ciliatum TaxID=27933 RepID=UPI0031F622EA